MLKNKKVMLALALPILLFGGYTMTHKKPLPKQKIDGKLYQMPGSFLLNLEDGRYAKLSVALLLAPGQSDGASAEGGGTSSESTVGTLPEETVIREIVTNTVTNVSGDEIISSSGRKALKAKILAQIRAQTDIKVKSVLIPDVTVQ